MKMLNYEHPSMEVIEIEIEDAVLNNSVETDEFGIEDAIYGGSIGRE